MVIYQSSSFSGKFCSFIQNMTTTNQYLVLKYRMFYCIQRKQYQNVDRDEFKGSYLQKNGKRSAVDIKRRNVRNLHCFRGIALERDP